MAKKVENAEKAEKIEKEPRPTKPFSEKLSEGGLGKRFFALAIDVCLFMIPSYLIASFGTIPAYTQREGGAYSLMQQAYSLMEETHLFAVTKSNGAYTGTNYYYLSDTGNSVTPGEASYSSGDASSVASDPSGDAYLFYHDMVYNYYTVYLPKVLDEYKGLTYIDDYLDSDGNTYTTVEQYRAFYYETALGLPSVETFNATAESERDALTEGYFTYDTMEDETGALVADTSVPAVLKSTYETAVNNRDSSTLSSLNTYFFDTTNSTPGGVYGEACNNFTGSGSLGIKQQFYSATADWYSSESLAAFMFVYFPFIIVFMLIIPMCDKYGRTLGKRIMGLQVCRLLDNGEGIVMKWWHNLMRCFYMTAILSPLGIFTIAPLVIGFIFMVSYFVLMFGKRHQSIHDVFLHTVVVNKKGSTIYASEEAIYDAKMEEIEEEKKNLYRPPEILDLSTINSAKELANKYDSFDEIEAEDVEVKTYTEYKKDDPAPTTDMSDYFDEDEEMDEDPLGLGDIGPREKINPADVKLTKDDDE